MKSRAIRNLIHVFTVFSLVSSAAVAGRGGNEGRYHGRRGGRRPASYTCDTSKHASLAYNSFYHRHDLAGCFHLGQALISCGKEGQMEAEKKKSVEEILSKAKRYCSEDRVSRHDVIELVRDAVRVIHDHNSRTISSSPESKDGDEAGNERAK